MTAKYDAFPSLRLYDQLNVPYVLFDGPWDGPLWTGHCMMLSVRDGYGDEGFAHELFHYLVTTPAQRRWPDFALGRQVNASMDIFTSSTTKHLFDTSRKKLSGHQPETRNDGWGETTIALTKATAQERAACNAMYLYHPLTGITTWDPPTELIELNVADDFAGMEYPGGDRWRSHKVAERCLPIVQAIDPSIDFDTVYSYLKRLNDLATAERFS